MPVSQWKFCFECSAEFCVGRLKLICSTFSLVSTGVAVSASYLLKPIAARARQTISGMSMTLEDRVLGLWLFEPGLLLFLRLVVAEAEMTATPSMLALMALNLPSACCGVLY